MRTLVVALSSSIAVIALACGGAAPAAHDPSHHEGGAAQAVKGEGDVKEPGEAKVGDKTRCPVSGEVFTVTAESPKVEYKGKTYFTCCDHCQKKLQSDPDKFLAKPKS